MKLEFRFLKDPDASSSGLWYLGFSFLFVGILSGLEIIPVWIFWVLILFIFLSSQLGRIKIKRIKEDKKKNEKQKTKKRKD